MFAGRQDISTIILILKMLNDLEFAFQAGSCFDDQPKGAGESSFYIMSACVIAKPSAATPRVLA